MSSLSDNEDLPPPAFHRINQTQNFSLTVRPDNDVEFGSEFKMRKNDIAFVCFEGKAISNFKSATPINLWRTWLVKYTFPFANQIGGIRMF